MAIDKVMHLDLQDMLVNYFKQYHFNKMSENVRAKFAEHVANNDLVGHMKDWKNNLWVEDGLKDPVAALQNISDDDLIRLYKEIRTRLQRLNQRRELSKAGVLDSKHPATQFLDEYFGEDNMFHESSVDESVKTALKLLSAPYLKDVIEYELSKNKGTEEHVSYHDLMEGLVQEKYNIDSTFRSKLENLIRRLSDDLNYGSVFDQIKERALTGDKDAEAKLNAINQLASVKDGFDPNPSKSEIEDFREELPVILNQVYSKKKLRETLFAGTEIANAVSTARDEVDYDKADSECFVAGKTDDQLTFMQMLKKEVTDRYEDYLEKYWHGDEKLGDHLYKSREAKEIYGAIKKVGIKKTDGLDKILAESSKIKEKTVAKMKNAGTHLKWFIDELTKLKKDMPKAFEGCLNNGWQLSRIIQQLIMDAINDDKMDEAKTAMELLVVLQYGNTTSGLMEKIRADKELFTLFSNKDLSWNKNEGVQFVTKALDKTIRIGSLAIGYGLTFVYNKVRQLGAKIKEKDGNKFFKSAQDKWANHNEEKETKEAALARAENRVNKYKQQVGLAGRDIQSDGDKKAFLDAQANQLNSEKESIETKLVTRDMLDNLENEFLYGLYGDEDVPEDVINKGQEYIKTARDALEMGQPLESLDRVDPVLLSNPKTKDKFIILQNLLDTDKQNYAALEDKQEQINAFNDAVTELKRAEAQRDKYAKQVKEFDADKKNKFKSLVDYWNGLITDNKIFGEQRTYLGSTKAAQKAYFAKLKSRAA